MRNVRSKAKRVIISRARKGIMSCLFASAAVLGLLATNEAVVQTCTPPPANMLSWWPGDGNANDIQGNNNGALQNGATFAPGMVGQAFSFDGIDDYVQATDTGLPFGSAARTLDFWIKPGFDARVPFIYGDFVPNDAFYVLVNEGSACIGQWGGGTPGEPCGSTTVADGNWHHIAMTYDGGSSVNLYVDGALEASVTKTYTTTSIGKLYIGSTVEGSQEYYTGLVDEVEIFDRALSQSEIQAIVNAGSAGKCRTCTPVPPNMVSWLSGDGNANDIKGSNNGMLQNGASFAAGLVGQAFLLDGIDDFINLGNAPNLHVSPGEFTVDAWVSFSALSHPPGANSGSPAGDMSIVDKMSPSDVNTDGWRLIKQDDNRFWFCFGGGGAGNQCGDPTFTVFSQTQAVTGAYFHVSAVKTATTFSIYVNGVLEDTRGLPFFTDTNSANLLIGANALEGSHFNGLIDEVEIFNRALSVSEIQAIIKADSAGKCKQVQYNFTGFFQPVDNLPTLNVAKAGSAIPVKFSLGGNQGLDIFAAGYPKSQAIPCDSTATVDGIEETVTASASNLSYDASSGRYIYVWKTDKSWVGTCRQLVVKLEDGTSHRANFTFK